MQMQISEFGHACRFIIFGVGFGILEKLQEKENPTKNKKKQKKNKTKQNNATSDHEWDAEEQVLLQAFEDELKRKASRFYEFGHGKCEKDLKNEFHELWKKQVETLFKDQITIHLTQIDSLTKENSRLAGIITDQNAMKSEQEMWQTIAIVLMVVGGLAFCAPVWKCCRSKK